MTPNESKQNPAKPDASKILPDPSRQFVESATPGVSKKPYRKPQLRRLGLLKSVAGSGISW
jgi:hypothetical protein